MNAGQAIATLSVNDVVTVVANLRHPNDHSFQGDALIILAIDVPFLAVRRNREDFRFSIDTRDFTLMRLSDDYVRALGVSRPTPVVVEGVTV